MKLGFENWIEASDAPTSARTDAACEALKAMLKTNPDKMTELHAALAQQNKNVPDSLV